MIMCPSLGTRGMLHRITAGRDFRIAEVPMLRLDRVFALFLLGLVPAASGATTPSPSNSTAPACITLVGTDGTNASALGTFTVIHRDLANNPIAGAQIVVDLSNAPDLRMCAQQVAPGVTLDCPNGRATAVTDANGVATFTLLGGSIGGPGMTLLNGGRIHADGVLIRSPTVAAYDLDGQGGVGANDLACFLSDFGSGAPYGRSDYDCSGGIGANDFSFWLSAFGAGTQIVSCATSCP